MLSYETALELLTERYGYSYIAARGLLNHARLHGQVRDGNLVISGSRGLRFVIRSL